MKIMIGKKRMRQQQKGSMHGEGNKCKLLLMAAMITESLRGRRGIHNASKASVVIGITCVAGSETIKLNFECVQGVCLSMWHMLVNSVILRVIMFFLQKRGDERKNDMGKNVRRT